MKRNLIVLFAFVVIAAAIAYFCGERFLYYKFDPELWKQHSQANKQRRYYMARYLIDHGLLIGKTRTEVESMLGKPESDSGGVIHYDLGPERGSFIRIDIDWLDIRFGDDSKVASNWIRPA